MKNPREPPSETLLERVQAMKIADRERLAKLEPEQAQAEVNAVLVDLKWEVCNPKELIWPGDLGDPAESPAWISNDE
jgi:hypothetical protein